MLAEINNYCQKFAIKAVPLYYLKSILLFGKVGNTAL